MAAALAAGAGLPLKALAQSAEPGAGAEAAAAGLPARKAPAQAADLGVYPDPASFLLSKKERIFKLHGGADDLSGEELDCQLSLMIEEIFDTPFITRYTLGRHWKKITEWQRSEFALLFRRIMIQQIQSYRKIFKDSISESRLEVKDVQEKKPGFYGISSLIIPPSGKAAEVQWIVKDMGGGKYKVRDISVEGISIIVNQRHSYASLIRSLGGFEPFLERLRERAGPFPEHVLCVKVDFSRLPRSWKKIK